MWNDEDKSRSVWGIVELTQQNNLVYNYNFLYYSNQEQNAKNWYDYNYPDGWVYVDGGSGAEIGYTADLNCCTILKSSDNSLMSFKQVLSEFPRWRDTLKGRQISAKIHLTLGKESEINAILSDGVVTVQETFSNPGTSATDYVFELRLTVADTADNVYIELQSESPGADFNIYKVYANIGPFALENLPCIVRGVIGERKQYVATDFAPAEELSLCTPSLELSQDYSRLDSVLNGRFGYGDNQRSLLPDMRGYFSRAWDNGATTDPDASSRENLGTGTVAGDQVGTVQADEFGEHTHTYSNSISAPLGQGGSSVLQASSPDAETGAGGGQETRPKNVYELYTIKWS